MNLRFDHVEQAPVLIVGAGVAGLSAALALRGSTVLTCGNLGEGGSTAWAQGGVAAAMDAEDTAADHARDTLKAGAGIVDEEAVRHLTESAPAAIRWMLELGARFDRDPSGSLALSREGGHGRRRVVHADGDATGIEILRTLTEAAKRRPDVRMVEQARAVDLAMADGRVVGVVALVAGKGLSLFLSPNVLLATGGAGQVFARTTNPPESTGDGIAMAARAGATLADMEFVQFHPTALNVDLDPMPLLTEALRGEGAQLVNDLGERFMAGQHPDLELAPRDIVARAIWRQIKAGRRVFLDAREVMRGKSHGGFGLCRAAAAKAGIDPETELLPVSPAAHYCIGGIAVDADGRSSLPGLWAAGETSSTGVHGANRLASNSLLEGMVFGGDSARSITSQVENSERIVSVEVPRDLHSLTGEPCPAAIRAIREIMWQQVGVERSAQSLQHGLRQLQDIDTGGDFSARNLKVVGTLIAEASLARKESRGAHFRSDFPEPDPEQAARRFQVLTPVERIAIEVPQGAPTG